MKATSKHILIFFFFFTILQEYWSMMNWGKNIQFFTIDSVKHFSDYHADQEEGGGWKKGDELGDLSWWQWHGLQQCHESGKKGRI